MKSVLLIRPVAAAVSLYEDLRKRGYTPFIEPLLTIAPSDLPRPAAKRFSGICIANRNALAALAIRREDLAGLTALPCYCLGSRTAEVARSLGFEKILASGNEGADLPELIKTGKAAKAPLLFAGGERLPDAVDEALNKAGIKAVLWTVYEAKMNETLSLALQQKLVEKKIDAVLVFSRKTGEHFVRLLEKHKLQACCDTVTAIGLNENAVEPLKALTWQNVAVAKAPSEESILSCLRRSCPVS